MKALAARLLFFAFACGLASQATAATLLYALTGSALLYSSADGGKTWQPITIPGAPNPANEDAFAVDPQNSSNLYVALDGANKSPTGIASGTFRSADGGATWSGTALPAGVTRTILHVDPTKSNIVYSALEGVQPYGGFFYSTDSGATWSAATLAEPVTGIGTDPNQPGVVYAGIASAAQGATGSIYRSANYGVTWTLLTSNPGFTSSGGRIYDIAVTPGNSSVLYAAGEGSCPASPNCGLFQSTNGGTTWQAVAAVTGWYKDVVIDSRNGNIYAGGVNPEAAPSQAAQVARSTDGGKTWTQTASGMSKFAAEVHLDPTVATTLYSDQGNLAGYGYSGPNAGPGGGVYISTNSGASWTLSPVTTPGAHDVVLAMAAVTAPGNTPTITTGGVVPIYSSVPVIQPGSWISIYGSNLAAGTSTWNNNFPTSLGGVSMTIDNIPAYLWVVTPTQINLQAPDDTATGTVNVVVTTASGTASSSVTLAQYGPSFGVLDGKHVAGVIATPQGTGAYGGGTYDLVGPTGPFTFNTRPVMPGETLILYGVGFGPTTPPVPAGQVFSGAASTNSPVTITIGGVNAIVAFAGITQAGLYQVNLTVPSTASGDQPVLAYVAGAQTPAGPVVTIQ